MIISDLLSMNDYPPSFHFLEREVVYVTNKKASPTLPILDTAILRTCTQLYYHCLPSLYGGNVFHFESPGALADWIDYINETENKSHLIKHMRLTINLWAWDIVSTPRVSASAPPGPQDPTHTLKWAPYLKLREKSFTQLFPLLVTLDIMFLDYCPLRATNPIVRLPEEHEDFEEVKGLMCRGVRAREVSVSGVGCWATAREMEEAMSTAGTTSLGVGYKGGRAGGKDDRGVVSWAGEEGGSSW
ncbi:hypothetical protein MMC24_000091 [Lignoscripta atroalba]|nr:hypothetical protein [Lignoscripta atroalba]